MILLLIGFTMRMLLFSDVIPACCADHTTFTEDLNWTNMIRITWTQLRSMLICTRTWQIMIALYFVVLVSSTHCFSSTVYPSWWDLMSVTCLDMFGLSPSSEIAASLNHVWSLAMPGCKCKCGYWAADKQGANCFDQRTSGCCKLQLKLQHFFENRNLSRTFPHWPARPQQLEACDLSYIFAWNTQKIKDSCNFLCCSCWAFEVRVLNAFNCVGSSSLLIQLALCALRPFSCGSCDGHSTPLF